jgi:outer membrane receptor protein involved in Fe transport
LTSEKILSGEAGYVYKFGGLSGRVSGFYTTFKDQVQTSVYYHDELNTFVNYIMNGIDKKHQGVELGIQGDLYDRFSFEAGGSIGQYIYTSRPKATITQDNSSEVLATDKTVYIKNYYVANGPQTAGSFTLKYNGKDYWFLNMTFNYFADAYLNINPDRRTTDGVGDLVSEFEPELWNSILDQTKLESNYTVDLFGRKSWKFGKYYIAVLASVSNLLDNKDFVTGGFEQYRYDYENRDVNKFPPRLYYAYGRNYSFTVNISLN